jgi:hypothetical protein
MLANDAAVESVVMAIRDCSRAFARRGSRFVGTISVALSERLTTAHAAPASASSRRQCSGVPTAPQPES